jgi:hypothetical protein
VAVVNGPYLDPGYGLDAGFDRYDFVAGDNRFTRSAPEAAAALLAELDRVQEPFFAYLHLFDPHLRYDPPEPRIHVLDPTYDGPVGEPFWERHNLWRIRDGELEVKPWGRRRLERLYDAEVAEVDAAVGALAAALEGGGRWERTLVCLTADHGEEFWDHGGYEHGHTLHAELLNVPWIVVGAGVTEGALDLSVASHVDIVPTLLERMELDPPARGPGAARLAPVPPADGGALSGHLFLGGEEGWALSTGALKLVSGGEAALYDAARDPEERSPLAEDATERELEARLWETVGALSRGWHLRVPPGIRAALSWPGADDAGWTWRPVGGESFLPLGGSPAPGRSRLSREGERWWLDPPREDAPSGLDLRWDEGAAPDVYLWLEGAGAARPLLGGEAAGVEGAPPWRISARSAIGSPPGPRSAPESRPGDSEVRIWWEGPLSDPAPGPPAGSLEALRSLGYLRD